MSISPLDIRKQEFQRVMRGYDPDEVRSFLDRVASELEAAKAATAALDEKLKESEDRLGHYRLIERNLQRAGVANEVHHVANGTEALALLLGPGRLSGPPPLVLLDLNLPDMSGTEILARIKADPQMRLAPVIVLTTTDDEREIRRCYELGCSVYITKPVNYETFADAIRKLGLFLAVIQVPPPTPR